MEMNASAAESRDDERYVAFAIDDLRLAVDLDSVVRVTHAVEIEPLAGAPESIAGSVVLRGERIAVLDLRPKLGLSSRELELSDRLVLVDCGPIRLFVIVDSVFGAVELPAARRRERARGPVHDCRVADVELDEGSVAIVDVERLLADADIARLGAMLGEARG